jgi:hypothetical protein
MCEKVKWAISKIKTNKPFTIFYEGKKGRIKKKISKGGMNGNIKRNEGNSRKIRKPEE